jgi:hypothetical protein
VWLLARSQASNSGKPDPRAAVQALVDAVEVGDLLGAMNTLPPAEAKLFTDSAQAAVAEAQRMKLLASYDLSHISGGSMSFSNLQWGEPRQLSDTVSVVPLRGGTVTVRGSVPDIPFTQQMFNLLDRDGFAEGQATLDIDDYLDRARHSGVTTIPVVTVRIGNAWYPSLLYSAAELAREVTVSGGRLGSRIEPAGAPSPEKAVELFVQQSARWDVRGAIALTDPQEDAVLHDYGTTFLRQFSPRDAGVTVTVSDLELKAGATVDGRVPVSVDYARVTVSRYSSYDGRTYEDGLQWDGACWGFIDDGRVAGDSLCPGDEPLSRVSRYGDVGLLLAFASPSISTVEVDGAWYVEVGRTFLDSFLPQIHAVTLDDILDAMDR